MTLVSLIRMRSLLRRGTLPELSGSRFSDIAKRIDRKQAHQAEAAGIEDAAQISGDLDAHSETTAIARRRLAHAAREGRAEAPEAREPDRHAGLRHGHALGEEAPRAIDPRADAVLVRSNPERRLEHAYEMERRDADAARDLADAERVRV